MDDYSEYEDWVELYNTTASPVNLNGYYLSDKISNPTKWQFGNATISANGFLRIWASGRNVTSGPNLHATFKLTQCKPEDIVLANPAGIIIDSQVLKPAQVGHSRGRTTNGASTWSVFLIPTPGTSNAGPSQEYATRPVMNVAAGFYPGTQNVSITSPDPNITIRYTTNGSSPTSSSAVFTLPIVIATTTVLRAKAFSSTPTIPASFIESNTYFINASHTTEVISVFGNQLATLMAGNQISPLAGLEYFDKTGTFKTESFGEVNKHGNDSWAYDQRGIDFVSRDQCGYNYALLGQLFNNKTRTEFQKIILKPAANDNFDEGQGGNLGPAHIRDAYVHVLSQKAKLHMDERTWAPCIVYINGNYWGVYETREKVDDSDFTDYYYNTPGDSLQFLKTWGATWAEYGGGQATTDWNALKNYILSNNMAVTANYNYVDNLFSGKSLADYVLLNSYVVCTDWLDWNTAWWRGINANASKKKWRYALWDMDATFDHYINYTGVPNTDANADPCEAQSLPDPGGQGHIPILNALLQNPGFKQYYVMRHFDLINSHFSCTRMIAVLDSMVNIIQPEMPGQIARWGGSMATWQQNVQDLRDFILTRCNSVVSNYSPCNGVTGTYPIKVNVTPAGAGTVDVNSINVSQFVWSANYPGASPPISINFVANTNAGYCFDHWEFQNHTPSPNSSNSAVSIDLTGTDSIVAVFAVGAGTASVTTTATTLYCGGGSAQLQVTSGSGFIWSPAAGLSNTTISNPVATPTITTTYTVITSGPCSGDTASITINVSTSATASVTASSTSVVCGTSTTLQASAGTNYLWSPAAGLNSTTISSPVASPTVTTTYSVIVNSNCGSDTANITITVNSGSNVSVTASSYDICIGESTTLLANSGTNFSWSPSAGLNNPSVSNPVATLTATTTYSVVVSDQCGSGSAEVTVTVNEDPVPVVSSDMTICNSESVELNASGGSSYAWYPAGGLSCLNCENPVASPPVTTTYISIVSNAKNCSASDSVTVYVIGDCPEIYVPTGFSPNGDNNNDVLYVFGTMEDLHFVIYNRWGEVVFETTDKLMGWNGTQKGKPVQSGIYAYKFTAIDAKGASIKKSGNITVIR